MTRLKEQRYYKLRISGGALRTTGSSVNGKRHSIIKRAPDIDGADRRASLCTIERSRRLGTTLTKAYQNIQECFLVLPVRIELTTSPLPRGCSTTELRQH